MVLRVLPVLINGDSSPIVFISFYPAFVRFRHSTNLSAALGSCSQLDRVAVGSARPRSESGERGHKSIRWDAEKSC